MKAKIKGKVNTLTLIERRLDAMRAMTNLVVGELIAIYETIVKDHPEQVWDKKAIKERLKELKRIKI